MVHDWTSEFTMRLDITAHQGFLAVAFGAKIAVKNPQIAGHGGAGVDGGLFPTAWDRLDGEKSNLTT